MLSFFLLCTWGDPAEPSLLQVRIADISQSLFYKILEDVAARRIDLLTPRVTPVSAHKKDEPYSFG